MLGFSHINFTLVAIISSVFGAVANILARTLLKDLKSRDILGINFLTMGITLSLLSPWFYFFHATKVTISLVVLIALIDALANYFFFKTFEQTEASVATPILSLAPAFTFLFSFLFLKDSVPLPTLLLSLGIIISIIIFSIDFENFDQFKISTLKPALISSVLFGISAIPSKFLLSNLHAINSLTLYMFRAGLIALFSLLFLKFPLQNITVKQFRTIFFRGLVVITQWGLLYWALSQGHAGVTITLANITPIFVFFFGALFLKERISIKKVITSVLILAFSLLI